MALSTRAPTTASSAQQTLVYTGCRAKNRSPAPAYAPSSLIFAPLARSISVLAQEPSAATIAGRTGVALVLACPGGNRSMLSSWGPPTTLNSLLLSTMSTSTPAPAGASAYRAWSRCSCFCSCSTCSIAWPSAAEIAAATCSSPNASAKHHQIAHSLPHYHLWKKRHLLTLPDCRGFSLVRPLALS